MSKYLASLIALVTPAIAKSLARRVMPHGNLDGLQGVDGRPVEGANDMFHLDMLFNTGTASGFVPLDVLEKELAGAGITLPTKAAAPAASEAAPSATKPATARKPAKRASTRARR